MEKMRSVRHMARMYNSKIFRKRQMYYIPKDFIEEDIHEVSKRNIINKNISN